VRPPSASGPAWAPSAQCGRRCCAPATTSCSAGGVYGPTLQLAQHLERLGVEHTFVCTPGEDWEQHLRPTTRLIHCESPGTYRMKVLDLRGVADVARARGITTVIDGTWATPLFQKPIEHGIDLVVHSLTPYVGGHSDVPSIDVAYRSPKASIAAPPEEPRWLCRYSSASASSSYCRRSPLRAARCSLASAGVA